MKTNILYGLALLILGLAASLVHNPRPLEAPQIPKLASMPKQMGTWHSLQDTAFDQATLRVLRPTDYLMRTYVDKQGTPITLYIGYHDGSPSAGPIHSPKNCLPGGGWEFKSTESIAMNSKDAHIPLIRAVLSKDGQDTTFYYWYQVRGEVITSDLAMKWAEFMGTVMDRRKDAAFVRISIDTENKDKEIQTMRNFFQQAYPVIKTYLPS